MATNTGLRRAYTVWATFYDAIVWFLRGGRRRSLALLDLRAGDSILLVGCGTGADFEFLPPDVEVTAVDRNFHAILARTSLELLREIPLGFGGLYVLYLLRRPGVPPP